MCVNPWLRTLLLSTLGAWSDGFYLPGVAPTEFSEGSKVELMVNKMTSTLRQLPYSYYDLPFCRPEVIERKNVNLGEALSGDKIENSAYVIHMMENKSCALLCAPRVLNPFHKAQFRTMIHYDYHANWIIDNLPASASHRKENGEVVHMAGFPIGSVSVNSDGFVLNNHVTLRLQYHTDPAKFDGYRIVGFEVEPASVRQVTRSEPQEAFGTLVTSCDPLDGASRSNFDIGSGMPLMFTYDVVWTASEVSWASRWDTYLKMTSGSAVHWLALLNSLVVCLSLAAVLAMILLRALRRDIARYNAVKTDDERSSERGWKLVHGDVFRKPRWAKLLAVSVGAGAQLLGMSIFCMIFAVLGLLSPAYRGGLLQTMMLLFTFMSVVAGYISARLCQVWEIDESKTVAAMAAFLYPGAFLAAFFALNVLIWSQGSSGAVPMSKMMAMLELWFAISAPLTFLGTWLGFRTPVIELPTRVAVSARPIKEQPTFMHPVLSALVAGLLPFLSVITELFFIMTSVWQHRFYYMFGFLALTLVVLIVISAEISISMTYAQLTHEDYHWWWRSFFYSGASAVFVFLYSAVYYSTRLQIYDLVPTVLYFGYMALASVGFLLLTGSIGTLSTFCFTRVIYSSIKID